MKKEIISAGEVLFDMISKDNGSSVGESTRFEKRIGGSPFNICCGLSRLGEDVSFFSQIADDSFGKNILNYLNKSGIDTKNTSIKEGSKTSLAFASVDAEGKADYEFYRENTADCSIAVEKAEAVNLDDCSIFHFGSLAIIDEPGNAAYIRLFERAFEKGIMTSFDPNVRPFYIKNKEKYCDRVKPIIKKAAILKLSDEDLFYITGIEEPQEALKTLPENPKRLDFITLGKEGCLIHKKGVFKKIDGHTVNVVDTVGCGDSFMAAILRTINNREQYGSLSDFELMEKAARFATACSAVVASRQGADSVPSVKEIVDFMD
jgi:fructokinase